MNPITGWLAALAFLVIAIAIACAAVKIFKKLRHEIVELKDELSKQKLVAEELYKFAAETSKVKADKDDIAQKIDEAKTDEEIHDIIASLIHSNNDRVHK